MGTAESTDSCPECGGPLGEPVSGDVHCYRECEKCGERFDPRDPRLNALDQ